MWDYTDGWANHYCCASAIYLLSFPVLEFCIIIDREVGAPGRRKGVVYGLNSRDKLMLKLETAKLLNPELIWDNPNFPGSCRFLKMNHIKL